MSEGTIKEEFQGALFKGTLAVYQDPYPSTFPHACLGSGMDASANLDCHTKATYFGSV